MSEDKKIIKVTEDKNTSTPKTFTPKPAINDNGVKNDKTNTRNSQGDRRGNNKRFNRRNNRRRQNVAKEFDEKVIQIKRVTKVTKGGRRFNFSALVVIGDHKGRIGFALSKAHEVPDAIKKAVVEAKKDLINVPILGTTVPHEVIGHFGASRVLIKPANKGKGIIAGGPSRAVMELSGIQDIYTKSLGSKNPINVIRATINGIKAIKFKKFFDDMHKPLETPKVLVSSRREVKPQPQMDNKEAVTPASVKEAISIQVKKEE